MFAINIWAKLLYAYPALPCYKTITCHNVLHDLNCIHLSFLPNSRVLVVISAWLSSNRIQQESSYHSLSSILSPAGLACSVSLPFMVIATMSLARSIADGCTSVGACRFSTKNSQPCISADVNVHCSVVDSYIFTSQALFNDLLITRRYLSLKHALQS